MESIKPFIKNTKKKTLVISSRSSKEYVEKNRFSRIAVVFALTMAFAIVGTAPASWAEQEANTSGNSEQKHHPRINITIRQIPDQVTPTLEALLDYQLVCDLQKRQKEASIGQQSAKRAF